MSSLKPLQMAVFVYIYMERPEISKTPSILSY